MIDRLHSSSHPRLRNRSVARAVLCLGALLLLSSTCLAADGDVGVFDFREAPLTDVLKLFSEMTGKNVVATPDVQKMKVTLFLQDVRAELALRTLCKNYNLWYTEDENVIRVMRVEEYGRELVLRRDEKTRVYNVKYASCMAIAETIAAIYGDRVKYTTPESVESYGHVGTDRYPVIGQDMRVQDAEAVDETIRRRARRGEIEAGGVVVEEADVKRLAEMLRTRKEITAEEMLQYQIGQARALLTVFPRNNAIVVRAVDANLLEGIDRLITELDTPTRQVMLEVKILEITLGEGFESFFNISLTPDGTVIEEGADRGAVQRDIDGFTGMDFVNAAGLPDSTVVFSFVDNLLQARMELFESQGRVREIATPLVMCANNAPAKFFQGVQSPVRKGYTVTEERRDAEGNVLTPTTIQTQYAEQEVGVNLEISPSINQDKTVTLKILADIGTLVLGGGPPFNYNVGGVPQIGPTDTVEKTEIEDIIVALNGQTLAIGGLIREEDRKNTEKVPFLGDIPILGFFFRSTEDVQERREIVFTITPHIMMSPHEIGHMSDRVMERLSEHPYYREKREHILRFDKEEDKVYRIEESPEGGPKRAPQPRGEAPTGSPAPREEGQETSSWEKRWENRRFEGGP